MLLASGEVLGSGDAEQAQHCALELCEVIVEALLDGSVRRHEAVSTDVDEELENAVSGRCFAWTPFGVKRERGDFLRLHLLADFALDERGDQQGHEVDEEESLNATGALEVDRHHIEH